MFMQKWLLWTRLGCVFKKQKILDLPKIKNVKKKLQPIFKVSKKNIPNQGHHVQKVIAVSVVNVVMVDARISFPFYQVVKFLPTHVSVTLVSPFFQVVKLTAHVKILMNVQLMMYVRIIQFVSIQLVVLSVIVKVDFMEMESLYAKM